MPGSGRGGSITYKTSLGGWRAGTTAYSRTLDHTRALLRRTRKNPVKFGIQSSQVDENGILRERVHKSQEINKYPKDPRRVGLTGGVAKDDDGIINGCNSRPSPSLDGRSSDL